MCVEFCVKNSQNDRQYHFGCLFAVSCRVYVNNNNNNNNNNIIIVVY